MEVLTVFCKVQAYTSNDIDIILSKGAQNPLDLYNLISDFSLSGDIVNIIALDNLGLQSCLFRYCA